MIECLCGVKIELLLLEGLWAIHTWHPAKVEERQVVRTIILPCKRLNRTQARCDGVLCTVLEPELDLDKWDQLGQWCSWTIPHKQWRWLTGRETTQNQLHWQPPHSGRAMNTKGMAR
ncbi:hypothetical protein [Pseudomonas shirazensis]|uniref:hypothetical protein n=1 Tax=Pseudomonas shirazensis TaxID=2745494 RepID=UPI001645A316|nr:hypothetical protein [Pseudomonas shirazensis]MBV4499897.1 hypothetical protein [Pseudomonas shirazensis]